MEEIKEIFLIQPTASDLDCTEKSPLAQHQRAVEGIFQAGIIWITVLLCIGIYLLNCHLKPQSQLFLTYGRHNSNIVYSTGQGNFSSERSTQPVTEVFHWTLPF